jgi:hypothetical protein
MPPASAKTVLRTAHADLLAGRLDDALTGCRDALKADAGWADAYLCVFCVGRMAEG